MKQLAPFFRNLPGRTLLLQGIVLGLLFIIILFLAAGKKKSEVDVRNLTDQLHRMNTFAAAITATPTADAPAAILAKRKENFSLFSFLDTAIATAAAQRFISSIEPGALETVGGFARQEAIILYEKGTMKNLVTLLTAIENQENVVTIRSVAINRSKNDSGLVNARITAVTLKKNVP